MREDRETLHSELGQLVDGLEPPAPAPELREAALEGARRALTEEERDLWARLWTAPSIRRAWLVAVMTMVLGHLLMSRAHFVDPPSLPLLTAQRSGFQGSEELSEVLVLPPIRLGPTTSFGLPAASLTGAWPVRKPRVSSIPGNEE